MRISVERARCEGHGMCVDVAPELFQLDDEGELLLLFADGDVPVESEDRARGAVRVCPIAALRLDQR
jgi:ferredoxin